MPRVIPITPGHLLTAELWFRDKYFHTYKSVMYYTMAGVVPSFEELQAAANTWHTTIGGEADDILDHEAGLGGVGLRYENVEDVDIQAMSTGAMIMGTQGDIIEDAAGELESLPPNCALNLRKFTQKRGRQNNGRLFIPFISETVQHDGIVDILNYPGVRQFITSIMVPPAISDTVPTPMHWNRKENKLVQITHMGCAQFISRRDDRRWKEKPLYIIPA